MENIYIEFEKVSTNLRLMKPNPPISKLLKHIKQQENAERILRQQGCPKSAFVRYSEQRAVIKSTSDLLLSAAMSFIFR